MNSMTGRIVKGMAAGLIAGLAASWVMSRFQQELAAQAREEEPQPRRHEKESAAMKAASDISYATVGRTLTREQRKSAGPMFHYTFGSLTGAAYGALAAWRPEVAIGKGLPFGAAVWLAMDEITVPLLGWSRFPTKMPISSHASALASHLIYGYTTDLIRRGATRII